MKQKIIDKLKFDKTNPKDHPYYSKMKVGRSKEVLDSFDGHIILDASDGGDITCLESEQENTLAFLTGDDAELEFTGWAKEKAKFIAEGIVTDIDIKAEKTKPYAQTLRTKFIQKIKSNPDALATLNQIKISKGLVEIKQ